MSARARLRWASRVARCLRCGLTLATSIKIADLAYAVDRAWGQA